MPLEGTTGVACLTRPTGFPGALCHACGRRPATVVVRWLRRGAASGERPATSLVRWYFCAAHHDEALVWQARLVARSDGAGRPPAALAVPFDLPGELLLAVEGAVPDRLVGLHWHRAADVLTLQASRTAFLAPPATRHWWDLVQDPAVAGWLREHMVDLGGAGRRATHHLVVDLNRGAAARVVRAADAAWLVARHAGALHGHAR